MGLVGAGRVHAGGGGGAHEGRRFFEDGAHIGGKSDDVVRLDEVDKAVEGGAEGIEELRGRGMLFAELFEDGARDLCRARAQRRFV